MYVKKKFQAGPHACQLEACKKARESPDEGGADAGFLDKIGQGGFRVLIGDESFLGNV